MKFNFKIQQYQTDAVNIGTEGYLDLLVRKSEMERILKKREELPDEAAFCSFCGKTKDEVRKLIASSTNVCICDECISICNDILEDIGDDEIRDCL